MRRIRFCVMTFILIAVPFFSYCQEETLDAQKYADCELFAQKSHYDWHQRLLQFDSLENREVTVFEVVGKDNRIKKRYTGKIENPRKDPANPATRGNATVITVVVRQNGQTDAYFPLTNSKKYRIYLKSCLN